MGGGRPLEKAHAEDPTVRPQRLHFRSAFGSGLGSPHCRGLPEDAPRWTVSASLSPALTAVAGLGTRSGEQRGAQSCAVPDLRRVWESSPPQTLRSLSFSLAAARAACSRLAVSSTLRPALVSFFLCSFKKRPKWHKPARHKCLSIGN